MRSLRRTNDCDSITGTSTTTASYPALATGFHDALESSGAWFDTLIVHVKHQGSHGPINSFRGHVGGVV